MTALFTVTCRARPLAVVCAESPDEAIARTRELVARRWRAELGVDFDVRAADEAETVTWLCRRDDLLLPRID
ncbi:MAG: hypothetical protein IRZ04_03135 [Rhodospirillales bacterium]|nr:hypothetical protein [Rhodospirillales bacterium]